MFHTAASILQNELRASKTNHIITFCRSMDKALGGGIRLGSVTEVSGESGCGKTQLAFQLCVNVQIDAKLGGVAGKAVFIDTENTFSTNRLVDIATSVAKHCVELSKDDSAPSDCTVEKILSSIYMFKCINVVELIATIHQLNDFIKIHPEVRLLVVDSIAHCVRAEEDIRTRNKILNDLALKFRVFAAKNNVAVVLINQVTTKFLMNVASGIMIPALGASWSHVAATKIILVKQDGDRFALLYKSSCQPRAVAKYVICKDGFRDAESEQLAKQTFTKNAHTPASETRTVATQEIREEFLMLSQRLLDEFCEDWDGETYGCNSATNSTYCKENDLPEKCEQVVEKNEQLDEKHCFSNESDDFQLTQIQKSPHLTSCHVADTSVNDKKRKGSDLQINDSFSTPLPDMCSKKLATNCSDIKITISEEKYVNPPLSPVLKSGNHRKRRKKAKE